MTDPYIIWPEEVKDAILGTGACLWTETVPPWRVLQKTLPRLYAYAECAWSAPARKDFNLFRARHEFLTAADRFLPDKAIDLVDEAAARLRTEIDSRPLELDEAVRRKLQLEIELAGLKKDRDDAATAERIKHLEDELAKVTAEADGLDARWKAEKEAIGKLRGLTSDRKRGSIYNL